MKKTGAWLARYALEQLPIEYIFGIPGVHNTELFDELSSSNSLKPLLVTHECHGAFMADAISRVSDKIGCLLIVPGAGVTHAASGIAEAYLDGIPMLIIAGGIRTDSTYAYQLHDIDQQALLKPITKHCFKVEQHSLVVPTLYEAYAVAVDGEPGPVFVELPVNLQLDAGSIDHLVEFTPCQHSYPEDLNAIKQVLNLLDAAQKPAIYVGWGARFAEPLVAKLAELLTAPVSTTLQGLSSFSAKHPLHTGFGFGLGAVPAARNAFSGCDTLIAIGCKFSEVGTASYGMEIPKNLVHIDINPDVFNKNYTASVCIQGDATKVLEQLLQQMHLAIEPRSNPNLIKAITQDKRNYQQQWLSKTCPNKVNPAVFFAELYKQLNQSSIIVVDDGNHTFLTAELLPIENVGGFISPTDFNCMGYAVPAAIGAKLAMPENDVVSIVGDGAFLMTAMELATASHQGIATLNFVFNDGELSQIAQAQQKPYNRKTCTQIAPIKLQALAEATYCEYLKINNDTEVINIIIQAFELLAAKKVVVVEVNIDYSHPSSFTQGVIKTNIKRLALPTKARMVGRALYRKIIKP
jgi:acetolactate synthase I/II/III large subunit